MTTLCQLRRRVDALRRRLAPQLAVLRIHRLADEFCLQWAVAVADQRPLREFRPFILRIASHGFRLPTFTALAKYLERCRDASEFPQCSQIVRVLLPWAAARQLLPLSAPHCSL